MAAVPRPCECGRRFGVRVYVDLSRTPRDLCPACTAIVIIDETIGPPLDAPLDAPPSDE